MQIEMNYINNALVHLNAGEVDESKNLLLKANELSPDNPDILRFLSVVTALQCDYEDALKLIDRVIDLAPGYGIAHSNRGNILKELNRLDDALVSLNQAISLEPNYAEAYNNKGNVLQDLHRYEAALDLYDRAIALQPNYAEAYSNKGNALHGLKQYEEALICHDHAISLQPNYAEAYGNKSNALYELRLYDQAAISCEQALSLKPDADWLLGNLVYLQLKRGDWSNFEENLEKLVKKIAQHKKVIHPFMLLALVDDPLLQRQCAQVFSSESQYLSRDLESSPPKGGDEKIKIGYFSADFRDHPVAFLTAELYELHDKDKFEVFAFSFGPNDESLIRSRLRKAFDKFLDVATMSDAEIVKMARELKIDIAIDLGGFTTDGRPGIFAQRAAPIQVNYLGYPGTLGSEWMDYIIADETVIPQESRQFYVEKVAYLPNSYLVDDSRRAASSNPLLRHDFGLPENSFVFCCLNNDYKFNKTLLKSWAKILLNVENSVLWIPENNKYLKANLVEAFEGLGIKSDRIIFAKRVESMADHLLRYSLADLFLDSFPYNAHTTAIDALKVGLPVLTCIGKSFASRVAASLLNAVKLPELVTTTIENYENLAIELAGDPRRLSVLKGRLRANLVESPLFDTSLFASHIENAYTQMYERYQRKIPLDHIYVWGK